MGLAHTNSGQKIEAGWWLTYPSEQYLSELVSWDDDIPFPINVESHKIPWFQSTNRLKYGLGKKNRSSLSSHW